MANVPSVLGPLTWRPTRPTRGVRGLVLDGYPYEWRLGVLYERVPVKPWEGQGFRLRQMFEAPTAADATVTLVQSGLVHCPTCGGGCRETDHGYKAPSREHLGLYTTPTMRTIDVERAIRAPKEAV